MPATKEITTQSASKTGSGKLPQVPIQPPKAPQNSSKGEAETVVTVKFFQDKPPIIICTGRPIGVGKYERQLSNIYRAIGKSKAVYRAVSARAAAEAAARTVSKEEEAARKEAIRKAAADKVAADKEAADKAAEKEGANT